MGKRPNGTGFAAIYSVRVCTHPVSIIAAGEPAARSSSHVALVETECRFRSLFEQAGDAFFVCRLSGRLVDVNEQACASLGFSRDELLQMSMTEVEITGSATLSLARGWEEPSVGIQSIAGRHRRKDGTVFPVEARVSLLVRDGRKHLLAIVRDMAPRQALENGLRREKEAAEYANTVKSAFLARMGNELRTPLNAVLGFSRLLAQQAVVAQDQQCAGHIIQAGERLLVLIEELMEVSRLENSRLELSIEPVSVADVVQESVAAVRPLAALRKIAIGVSLTAFREYLVVADRGRLRQILIHLLTNAVKFSDEETGIAVDYHLVGGQVRVCVHDRGCGIAPELLGRLFKPFERLAAHEAGVPGAGLGLVLCKHLAEALGGTIGVDSVAGQGSSFWVQLPGAEDYASAPVSNESVTGEAAALTVLYIDDDESNLKLIEYLVQADKEIRLLTARRGDAGIEIAISSRPDLIMLDLHLPDRSGEEVLSRLRSEAATRDIPVIAVSGDTAPERIAQLASSGVWTYLTKPVDLQEVLNLLSTVKKRPKGLPAAA